MHNIFLKYTTMLNKTIPVKNIASIYLSRVRKNIDYDKKVYNNSLSHCGVQLENEMICIAFQFVLNKSIKQ